jgi:hypothetical protein
MSCAHVNPRYLDGRPNEKLGVSGWYGEPV